MSKFNAALNGEWAQHVRPFGKRITSKARRRDAKARRSNQPSESDWWDGHATGGADNSPWRCDCCEDSGCPCCKPEVELKPEFRIGEIVGILAVGKLGPVVDVVIGYGTVVGTPHAYKLDMNIEGDMEWVIYGDYDVVPAGHIRGRPTERYSPWRLKKLGLLETLAAASL